MDLIGLVRGKETQKPVKSRGSASRRYQAETRQEMARDDDRTYQHRSRSTHQTMSTRNFIESSRKAYPKEGGIYKERGPQHKHAGHSRAEYHWEERDSFVENREKLNRNRDAKDEREKKHRDAEKQRRAALNQQKEEEEHQELENARREELKRRQEEEEKRLREKEAKQEERTRLNQEKQERIDAQKRLEKIEKKIVKPVNKAYRLIIAEEERYHTGAANPKDGGKPQEVNFAEMWNLIRNYRSKVNTFDERYSALVDEEEIKALEARAGRFGLGIDKVILESPQAIQNKNKEVDRIEDRFRRLEERRNRKLEEEGGRRQEREERQQPREAKQRSRQERPRQEIRVRYKYSGYSHV
ncbi:hypothetical protein CC80DRAFT_542849 [Byssothecium circinans]|uniref:Uncharacterized protein n=1 Tax=Byssothecium circinans TaxID=147558 RepID=A0A6A5UCX1_9PLEO|nr:hypothetical protein CC80DRAFT_542849 [Byssothecium circinans]